MTTEVKVHKTEKEKKEAWGKEEVNVEFMNLEEPGVPLKFAYGPCGKQKTHTFLHGGKYKMTRELVEHIESRQTPIWKYRPNGEGGMAKELTGYKPRFQCRQTFG